MLITGIVLLVIAHKLKLLSMTRRKEEPTAAFRYKFLLFSITSLLFRDQTSWDLKMCFNEQNIVHTRCNTMRQYKISMTKNNNIVIGLVFTDMQLWN